MHHVVADDIQYHPETGFLEPKPRHLPVGRIQPGGNHQEHRSGHDHGIGSQKKQTGRPDPENQVHPGDLVRRHRRIDQQPGELPRKMPAHPAVHKTVAGHAALGQQPFPLNLEVRVPARQRFGTARQDVQPCPGVFR